MINQNWLYRPDSYDNRDFFCIDDSSNKMEGFLSFDLSSLSSQCIQDGSFFYLMTFLSPLFCLLISKPYRKAPPGPRVFYGWGDYL